MIRSLLVTALAGSITTAAAQTDSVTIVDSAGADIARVVPADWVGEHLYYDAKLAFLNVGRAELVVLRIDSVRGTPALHIRFIVDGGAPFYRLHNVWDSWIDLENFASLRFIQDHDEGGRRYRNAYEIFPDSGYYRRAGQDSLHPTSAVPLDDAAFFYFVRTTELVPGETYEYHSYFKPDRNPVTIRVLERDTIDVPAGRFPSVVVQPIIKGGGIFRENARGRMWISDDEHRRVVQIKAKIGPLSLTFRLLRVETRDDAGASSP